MAKVSLRGYGGAARQAARTRPVGGSRVQLRCGNPALNLVVYLGPDPPTISGGFGGWEVTQRPRAVGMTTWAGVPPFELTLNVLLGWQRMDHVVETEIQQLIDVARGTTNHVPGVVRIDGIPSLPAASWVINNLDFGDVIRDRQMQRVRQLVTITFLEYMPPQYETLRKGALKKPRPKTVKYTVKKGDTPIKIAKHRRCKWTDIRAVNKKGLIKKANQNLKDGSRINVPVMHQPHKKKHRSRGGKH